MAIFTVQIVQVTNMDPYLEIALEVGAEDVICIEEEGTDGEKNLVLKVGAQFIGQVVTFHFLLSCLVSAVL
jgi:outer membrane lipopolysaccharide assembly protein LptE/RlpB